MILKHADDKSKRLALLQELQNSPVLDQKQKRWLREELVRLRQGVKGEQESAYFLAKAVRTTSFCMTCGSRSKAT